MIMFMRRFIDVGVGGIKNGISWSHGLVGNV